MNATLFSESPESIKCLTIRQPWAHLIVTPQDELPPDTPVKRVENRSKLTHYRGPLLIHAGLSRDSLGLAPQVEPVTFGAILGVCNLSACIHVDDMPGSKYASLAYATGPYCLILRDVRRFETPIPYLGQLAMFSVPFDVVRAAIASGR